MSVAQRVAVIHAVHDGILSMHTGVGRVAANIVATFDEVGKAAIPNCEVSLHLITTEYPDNSPAYSLAMHQRSQSAVEAYGGTLNVVSTAPGCVTAREIWGGPDRWRLAGEEAFDIAMEIADQYDRTIVFAHDIVFAHLLNKLQQIHATRMRFVWIPHSTARLHRFGLIDNTREEMELEVAASINRDSRAYAGAIGEFMRRHLLLEFGISGDRIVAFTNGLVLSSAMYPSMTLHESADLLRHAGVPKGKPVVLFWGRGVPEKGVDILIDAWMEVRSEAHLLLIAPPETGTSEFLAKMIEGIKLLGGRATAVLHFDPLLPFAAMTDPNTAAVVVPSRSEPCSLTAMEAKLYSRGGAFVTLIAAVDGLMEQAVPDGTLEAPLHPSLLAEAIDSVLLMPVNQRREMAQRAHMSLTGWNFARNYVLGMSAIWDGLRDDVMR